MAYRHSNPYATHIPILIGFSRVLKIKRVLEYGGGNFSTRLFLNKEVYPEVTGLTVCENDTAWLETVRGIVHNDGWPRATILSGIDELPADKYDLVFIDADTESHKLDLIKLAGKTRRNITVVHDSEHAPYAQAINNSFQRWFSFAAFNPETAIAWNGAEPMTPHQMLVIDMLTKKYSNVDPTDILQWSNIFDSYKELLNAASSVS